MNFKDRDQDQELDHDQVGYCKPPKHTRFKPGQSGNPRGRPRKSRDIQAMIKRELDQPIAVKEGGRELRLSKREALIKQLVNRAVSGDAKAMQFVLTHLEKHKDIEPFTATEADDAELLKALGANLTGDDDVNN